MSELPPDIARLLAAERSALGPSEAARERVQARVESTLGLAVGAAAGVAGAAAATAATGKVAAATGKAAAIGWQTIMAHAVATKLVIVVAATGSVVGAGYVVTRAVERHEARKHATAHAAGTTQRKLPRGLARAAGMAADEAPPATIPSGPIGLADPAAPAPVAAPPLAATTAAVAAPPVPPAPAVARSASTPVVAAAHHAHERRSGLSAERELVAAARQALLAHDFDGALQAIDRHARQFPAGQLAEERDSLRVRVAAARGQHDRAAALADDFARVHPGSLFGAAVRAAAAAGAQPR